ncbi:MAG: phosphatidate cytidylyltransferase [Legionellales bacterium RIFCSPHIGHO2_12_FULL_35_11]|nr:MAG: phosphatidate cytidylyltransferase [Legionellales bacterium RIFCSPHIGHO2_12_FULL_35_11]
MFKQRLLTTLILVPLVFLAIYYGNTWTLSAVTLGLLVAIGWEWLSLIVIKNLTYKFIFMVGLLVTFFICIHFLNTFLKVNFIVWAMIIPAIIFYPKSEKYFGNVYVVGLACLFIASVFISSLYGILVNQYAKDYLVYLLLLVWATDIGAYLTGKKLGRHKLIPNVSPGKTIEGTIGGFILAMLVATLAYFYFKPTFCFAWFGLAVFIVFISIFGDLFISMLKRRCKVKDTGNLLPGHGGVLDRLDSLIAALPFFYFFSETFL